MPFSGIPRRRTASYAISNALGRQRLLTADLTPAIGVPARSSPAQFVEATPLTETAVAQREREELVTRFFAYLNRSDTPDGRFPGYRDRPKKFLYDYLKEANAAAEADAAIVPAMREEFVRMLNLVSASFPLGFRKTNTANTVPRVRFEAISVGSALALRQHPDLVVAPEAVADRMANAGFDKIVVSDGANVRSKLEGRIDLGKSLLINE